MEISKRLQTVASLVRCRSIADIGTDHGYVPLTLWQQHKIDIAFACDINRGPLTRAAENIARMGASDAIQTRLGSGLAPLAAGEAQSIVIAGMGGMLICNILSAHPEVVKAAQEWILSPQHDLEAVRRLVGEMGFVLDTEVMVQEDGKFYHIFRCVKAEPQSEKSQKSQSLAALRYGGHLLEQKDALLWQELQQEEAQYKKVIQGLENQNSTRAAERLAELREKLAVIEEAKAWYK